MLNFGIGLVPVKGCNATLRHSINAEKVGIKYVFISDNLKGRNLYICLTALAYNTQRILIGPGITNPYFIHPVTIAQILSSLNEIAPNRLVCGIGAGDATNLKRAGIKQNKPLAAVKEASQIIRTILAGETVDIDGVVFKISEQNFGFPKSEHLPIFIGAQGKKMLKLAAEVGDGVIINAAHPDECGRAVQIVRSCGNNVGRDMNKFEFATATPFSVARKSEDAIKKILPGVAVIVAGSPDSIMERHGISLENRDKIKKFLLYNDHDALRRSVTPEMIDLFSITGTPENCTEKIRLLAKAGVSLVVLYTPLGPDPDKAIDIIAQEIMPQFN
jgi:5,10-methylenetetrahydromethanopterin reductase